MSLIQSAWAQQWPAVVQQTLAAPPGLVVFDMDGTLLSGDVGEAVFLARLAEGVCAPGLRALLGDSPLAAYRRFQAEGPDEVHYAACALGLWGLDEAGLDAWVARLVARGEIALRPALAALCQDMQAAGHRVVVVTGTAERLARRCLLHLGLDLEVIGQGLVIEDGILQDQVVEPILCGPGKIVALDARVGQRPLFMAGDSRGDFALMSTVLIGALVVPPGPGAAAEAALARGFSVLLPAALPPPPTRPGG